MSFFTQLTNAIRWASGGTVATWTEADRQAGWEKIGTTAPSRTEFNMYQQDTDDKILWIFKQIKTLADARGVTLSAGDYSALLTLFSATPTETQNGTPLVATATEARALTLAGKMIDPAKLGAVLGAFVLRDVTASRAVGVTYTNATKALMLVNIQGTATVANATARMIVDGKNVYGSSFPTAGNSVAITAPVPPGVTYSAPAGAFTPNIWTETSL